METFIAEGRKCILWEQGSADVAFILPVMASDIEGQLKTIRSFFSPKDNLCLVAFEIKDWDRELTPWESNTNERHFGSDAGATLSYIEYALIPELKRRGFICPYITVGYSLAGLFSLWALFNSELINGAVSASGSLWYEHFEEYAEKQLIAGKTVYLSLGDREELTRNAVMRSIGDKTRKMQKILEDKYCRCTLEMNRGGHFSEPEKRLFKGMKWMLENYVPQN